MQWFNHKATTAAITYTATGDLVATAVAAVSSVLPDFDFIIGIQHRTYTHWPYPYLVIIGVLFLVYSIVDSLAAYYAAFVFAGCLLHVMADALSKGGVPLRLPTTPPVGLNLYKLKYPSEYITAAFIVVVFGVIAWLRGILAVEYLLVEARRSQEMAQYFTMSVVALLSAHKGG